MIGVGDSTVEITKLIEGHLLEIGLMEIVGQSLLIVNRQPLVEEIKEGVDKRGWDCDQAKIKDSLNEYCFVSFDD